MVIILPKLLYFYPLIIVLGAKFVFVVSTELTVLMSTERMIVVGMELGHCWEYTTDYRFQYGTDNHS